MHRISLLTLTLTSTLLFASSDEALVAKGNEVSSTLIQKLGGELKAHMQSEGAIGALNYCSLNAISLTESIAKTSNTSIKRVSVNNRNPLNSANADEKKVLEKWETKLKNNQPLPPYEFNQKHYYKPITINNEACLKCHGKVEGDLAKAIKTTYPEDKAVGYKMGDLRGMIVIEMR